MSMIQYVDPDTGVDNDGRPGTDISAPRATPDFAAAFTEGKKVLIKRGTTLQLTGSYVRENGATVNYGTSGPLIESGTVGTLLRNRVYFGAYGEGARPIIDALGVQASCLRMGMGVTVENLDLRNAVTDTVSIGAGAENVIIRRNRIHGQTANNNNGSGVYVRAPNCLIEMNTFDDNGSDNIVSDASTATDLKVRDNHVLNIGAKSLDGTDGMVATLSDATEVTGNFFEKVSRQKQGMVLSKQNADTITTGPIIEKNCFVGISDGSGMVTLNSVAASTYRRNFIIGNRGVILEAVTSGRVSEGCEAYGNVFIGLQAILRPALTGSAEIDADGYADGYAFGGAVNASAPVLNTFNNNFAYNFQRTITTGFTLTGTNAHNNVLVRMKGGAMAGSGDPAVAGSNLIYDDAGGIAPAAVYTGSPIANFYHDSTASGKPARIDGAFPLLSETFGIPEDGDYYYAGDATKAPAQDITGAAFATEDSAGRCNVGTTSV